VRSAGDLPVSGDTIVVRCRLNGAETEFEVDPGERLLDTLRYRLDLTGTKEGCAEGECGACTVLLDGIPANSCLVLSFQVAGRRVETVESLEAGELDPFLAGGATQCGACTPGVVMTASWLLANGDLLDSHRVRELMAGNLCRCTGYDGIIESIDIALGTADGEVEA
jgi:aerobic-type carbon monoxide dehydrogenase small subunit (CoxS/CutS family)